MINELRVASKKPNARPIVVHCSAGIGRTGTLITLFNLMSEVDNFVASKQEIKISVFNTIRKLREQRFGAVQTLEQYDYIYRFILAYIKGQFN